MFRNKKLKANDWVTWAGERGVVVTTSAAKPGYPIQVMFPGQKEVHGFQADGRYGGEFEVLGKTMGWKSVEAIKFVRRYKPTLWAQVKAWFKRKKKK